MYVLVKNAVPPHIGVNLLIQDHLIHFIVGSGGSNMLGNLEALTLLNGWANIASIVVIFPNMFSYALHRCDVAVYFLVVVAIKYKSIQFRCVAFELGEGLTWRSFKVLVSFCSRFVIASSSGFMMRVLGILCNIGRFHVESEERRVSSLCIVKGEIFWCKVVFVDKIYIML